MLEYPAMDPSLVWAAIGLVLVISELLTGTFYLLMLGTAAFAAAGVAFFGQGLAVQAIVAAAVAAAGCWGVHVCRARSAS